MQNNLKNATAVMIAFMTAFHFNSCSKKDGENSEPKYCFECTVEISTERTDGMAWDYEKREDSHCDITEAKAEQIEKNGTWKKQMPDNFGIRLLWVDQKTICNRK